MTITLSSQGSLELSIVILPLQERPRRRSLRTVQHHGPCQAEGHCGGVGQVAGHSNNVLFDMLFLRTVAEVSKKLEDIRTRYAF